MREDAPLGPAGGPRGVDERGEIVGAHPRDPLPHDVVGQAGALGDQLLDRPIVDLQNSGETRSGIRESRGVLRPLDDRQDRSGVLHDPLDLFGRRGVVDRYGHRAGGPDREVEQGPLESGRREQNDAVARRNPDATSPFATPVTRSANSVAVTSTHSSAIGRENNTRCGLRRACSKTVWTIDSSAPMVNRDRAPYSRMCVISISLEGLGERRRCLRCAEPSKDARELGNFGR